MNKVTILALFAFLSFPVITESMEKDAIALDDLVLGEPYSWKPYLEKYSLKDLFATFKKFKIKTTMVDAEGNNLFLAFINFEYKNRCHTCDSKRNFFQATYTKQLKKYITDFVEYNGFDIDFHNKNSLTTFLMLYLDSFDRSSSQVTLDFLEWLIKTYKPNLNQQDEYGRNALWFTADYDITALLLKYGANPLISIPNFQQEYLCMKSSYSNETLKLITMFGVPHRVQNHYNNNYLGLMIDYNILLGLHANTLHSKLTDIISKTNFSHAIFNRAAICNDRTILHYFVTKVDDQSTVLLKIIEHCAKWNRAGATRYALETLNPNRALIFQGLQKKGISGALIKIVKYYSVPSLEQKLIKIYQNAYKDPKTGFKAWNFLEVFDHYLTYGHQHSNKTTEYKDYQQNFDLNVIYL